MTKSDGQIKASASIIGARCKGAKPQVAIILGSGLGLFADCVEDATVISYDDLPGFPEGEVSGHGGRLLVGRVAGTRVAVMQGRAHYYEQGDAAAMKVPIRVLKEIGCETLLISNAAGSTNPDVGPGRLMLLSDHISFTGVSPLIGEPGDQRFVDLTDAYDPDYRKAFAAVAARLGLRINEGVYMWFCGPNFETPAEIRAATHLGADAVGMSTVPEVILARHAGMRVAALSIITNLAAGLSPTELSHAQTLENAEIAGENLQKLLLGFLLGYQS